ncbi:FAD-binding domain-containing protein [Auriscalpium vulgare]|uniref:FAD-binding domain-containing protein n=1 Tax=Auriscalpium vulgare TaxID=40419 RepID=A0ACB8RNQ8_9AGAM|nr:FAD-binding domain-containing protein [Auriscalpium vulgare]
MAFLLYGLTIVAQLTAAHAASTAGAALCRNLPGDPGFPTQVDWNALNASVNGRLVAVTPSAKACGALQCTEAQWTSGLFRETIAGAMNQYNWEQDYAASPPGLCLQNGTTCSQGMVPVYAVNATSAADIQAGVKFASAHNLRVAIKATGHDYLGRSTAKGSLLLWTQYFKNVTFTDSFVVGGVNQGSAVTVGSGVGLKAAYSAAKDVGKIIVGGTAATVAPAGGYTQGAGHSALAPIFGLAVDNALEYQVVIASGELVTLNAVSNPDLFWAIRGGGAGSWGVIISATFKTYPTYQLTIHQVILAMNSIDLTVAVMAAHAKHIFDWDGVRAGQYYYLTNNQDGTTNLAMWTYFSNLTDTEATAQMAPLLTDATALGATVFGETTVTGFPNDILTFSAPNDVPTFSADDAAGVNLVMGSRLIPATAYLNTSNVGAAYKTLVEGGAQVILGLLVAGGKVSENVNISSAVNPKWRTAKTHVIVVNNWDDTATSAEIEAFKHKITDEHVPALAKLTGESDSASYTNEADAREPNWKTTFYGVNYPRLLTVKAAYDPNDLFIVPTGVGSDRWDAYGVCRV